MTYKELLEKGEVQVMNEIKLVAHDSTNHEIGGAEDLCVDIWDDADPERPHPVIRVYFCDGDHDREKLINHILEYREHPEGS